MRLSCEVRRLLPSLKISLPETRGEAIGDTLIYTDRGWRPAKLYQRKSLNEDQTIEGACIILQTDTTIYLPEDWRATTDRGGNLICERSGSS